MSFLNLNSSSVSTHSRLKAAAPSLYSVFEASSVSTHSRLKAAEQSNFGQTAPAEFQHTAA